MDIRKMLAELRQELAQVDEVILNLERLAMIRGRRGRPPASLTIPRRRGRPLGSRNRSSSVNRPARRPLAVGEQPQRALAAGQSGPPETIDIPA